MASIAYITDRNMIEFHRLNGNRTMNFWRPSNSKKFTDFKPGDLLFFLAKGSERGRHREKGIVGYGRFQKAHTLSFRQMWNVYGTENGYASEDELYDAIVKVSKNKKMPKLMNCLYLTDVVFFQAPIYLSEIGVAISNKVESYIYLDKEDPQATSKVLNKAKETGVDMWMAAMSETLSQNFDLEEEQIKHQLSQIIERAGDSFYTESEKKRLRRLARQTIDQKAEEKKPAEEKTYEATNAPTTLTEKAQEAARNVVKIINDYASPLKVILRNLKVDAGDTGKDAVKIEGTGDVTLELEGKNELTGGNSGDYGTRGITSGKGKLTIQGKEGSSLSTTGGSGTKGGSFGICATSGKLDLVNATVTATGGFGGGDGISANDDVNIKNSKLTAKGGGQLHPGEDTSTGGGTGISLFVKGKVVVGEGSEVIAIGGDDKAVKRSAWGGAALRFWGTGVGCGYEVQKGGKLTAIGGNAESERGGATGGDALWGEKGGIVSAGETTLIGGNAKSGSGKATGGNASFYNGDSNQVTVKGGTTTALGGKAENNANTAVNGSSIKTILRGKIGLSVETGGTLVTAMPGERDGKGNGIIGDVEIKTDGGKIEEVENAKVVKKEDGSITVTGDLVGIKQDGHSYELTATVEPTCTTPGKRVYTCTTHEDETYEETIDALGHHFTAVEVVAPTYTSEGYTIYKCETCGETEKRDVVPMLVPESNGGSSAVTLTVTGAGAYETSIADGRYIIAVPAENAVLSGCLSNLKELKAQGADTIVFRTQLRETALNIDRMLSLGVDDTLFTLTHSGESAELTVGGFAHNELLH